MTMIFPFKGYMAGLFNRPSKAALPVAPPPRQNTAVPAPAAPQRSAPIANSGLGGYEAYKDPEFVRDARAAIARSEAAMAVWEAGEAKFEQENGFRRKVNSMALGSYAQAQSGNFGVPSFSSADEAAEYMEYLVSSMTSNASTIKSSAFEAQSLARPEVAAFYGEVKTGQLLARYADSQKAAEMDMFVLNAVFAKTFGTANPITSQQGGEVSFKAQDFSFGGKAIARLSEDGTLTRLIAPGDPSGIDRRV